MKSVEYYIKSHLQHYKEDVHFCCTSEDINNLAYALMLKDAIKDIIVPKTDRLIEQLTDLSEKWADCPMLAHTHGQPASPTTIGKEYSNFTYRLE